MGAGDASCHRRVHCRKYFLIFVAIDGILSFMVKNTSPILSALRAATANEAAAVAFLEAQRWGGAPTCPRCESADVYVMKGVDGERNKDYRWRCKGCQRMYTVRTGTTF